MMRLGRAARPGPAVCSFPTLRICMYIYGYGKAAPRQAALEGCLSVPLYMDVCTCIERWQGWPRQPARAGCLLSHFLCIYACT